MGGPDGRERSLVGPAAVMLVVGLVVGWRAGEAHVSLGPLIRGRE
jgi:hypothetical protein